MLDALRDRDVTITVCRNEARRRDDGRGDGQGDGAAGHLFCHARSRRDQRFARRAYRAPRLDADAAVRRADRARVSRTRRVSGNGLPRLFRLDRQMGDGNRRRAIACPKSSRAPFICAMEGRPGPVVVSLPKDMLTEPIVGADARASEPVETFPAPPPWRNSRICWRRARPSLSSAARDGARRPFASVQRFAERFELPVATSYRRGPLFDASHPCYAGDLGLGPNPKLIARIKQSDLPILLGGRLGEIPSQGFTLFEIPGPRADLIHIHASAEEFGRSIRRASHPRDADRLRRGARRAHAARAPSAGARRRRRRTRISSPGPRSPTPQPGAVNLGAIMVWLRGNVPPDTILCNGAGNYAVLDSSFLSLPPPRQPYRADLRLDGLWRSRRRWRCSAFIPNSLVLSINGDGDFLMNGQEFATAVQYDLPIIVIVCDNASYGTIRMHQEREYPGRVCATDLRNPDFASYARAFGGFGATVEKTEDFPAAFEAARAARRRRSSTSRSRPTPSRPSTTLTRITERALAKARERMIVAAAYPRSA